MNEFEQYKYLPQEKLQDLFYEACKKGELDKVSYLLNSPELDVHAEINKHEGDALICAVNNLQYKVIDYLLSSPELKEHINIHTQNDFAIIKACENGDTEMVKYLLTSPNLKEHSDIHTKGKLSYSAKDRPFLMAYICERMNVLEYLILDYYIPYSNEIKKLMSEDTKEITPLLENMFKMRVINKELNQELSTKLTNKNKIKL